MKDIDLETYKSAWKDERGFDHRVLSETEIKKVLNKKSKSITSLFRLGLTIDIALKLILGISFIGIIWLFFNDPGVIVLGIVSIVTIVSLLIFQIKTYKKIPQEKGHPESLRNLLESKINFYRLRYFKSVYIVAFSNPLIFISGMLYYFYFKYGEIRPLQIDDYLVFSAACIIGFAFGAFVQIKQYNFQIRQLEVCLTEIDENTINELTLKKLNKQRLRVFVIFILVLVLGLLLLTLILS